MRVVNIIPTYNEKENILEMLLRLEQIAEKNPKYDFYHLVADDLSPDGTADIVREKMKSNPRIKLITGPRVGLGEALIRAYRYAVSRLKGDLVIPHDEV